MAETLTTCEHCGVEFFKKDCEIKRNKHHFCSKNRHSKLKEEQNPNSKLTKNEVLKIIELYKTVNYTSYKLAEMFNISRPNINCITNRKTWRKE